MGKKLTEKELRAREVTKVVQKIKKLENLHSKDIVRSACYKYNIAIQDRARAEKEIEEAEKRLADAKRRLR